MQNNYRNIILSILILIGILFFIGKIGPTSPSSSSDIGSANLPCLENNQNLPCWRNALEEVIKKEGLESGFSLFTKFFETEPVFAQNCHDFTHQLGEAAHEEFSETGSFPVTQQVSYCSYGFFHGFIEAMMQENGNLVEAKEMCRYVDRELSGETATLGACYHGIGHGVTDGANPSAWGDVFKMINPGLELCEEVGDNQYDTKICGTGVFNSLAIMYPNPKYKLDLDRQDPLWICRQQTKSYFKHACYDDFKSLLMGLTGNDFTKAANFIEQVDEDDYAKDAMDNLATYYVYYLLKDPSYEKAINECHGLQERLRVSCISGLGAGFMTAGIPDKEYIRALELCGSSLITEPERDGCYSRVIRLIALRYSQEKYNAICQTIDDKYQNLCRPYSLPQ